MKCAYKSKDVSKNASYWRGVQAGVDSMLIMLAYVLSRYGYKGKKIQQIIKSIEDVADSINKGYCTHQDLEDTLWDEYRIRMRKRKEWLQGRLEE